MSTIAENIAAIRARIDAAARTTGRTGADITLVAATKMNDAARVREAVAAFSVISCTRFSPPGSTPAARTACRR